MGTSMGDVKADETRTSFYSISEEADELLHNMPDATL
jgi:hypothetical protein